MGNAMNFDYRAKRIIQLLLDCGYKAYAVGGCVRDNIMQREVGDTDIATSAMPWAVEQVLSDNSINFAETGLKHGTITAIIDGEPFEITTFRTDGEYLDNRHPDEVCFVDDIKQDLARRDFTMNAIAYNDDEGIIDIFGGEQDIKNKTIRAVGNADKRFKEDALRIMRALRFSSVLGFEIEMQTKKALFDNKELLKNIAKERIFTELKKLLLGDNCERVLLEYRDIMAVIIPELEICFDYPQNSKWHIYDVYTHIVKSVALTPKKDYLRIAVLLHDIGKPYCRTTDKYGQDHFKGHPKISAELAEKILRGFKVSNELLKKAVLFVKIHDRHITEKPSNIKMWLRELDEELIFDFIELKIADLSTHNLTLAKSEIEELRKIKGIVREVIDSGEPYKISHLKINGADLVNIGLERNQISEELERLAVLVSDDPGLNNRDDLINQATRDKFELYN